MGRLRLSNKNNIRTHLKKVDQVSGQDANRFESGAYTVVCEHFESAYDEPIGRELRAERLSRAVCNAAMGT